MEQQTVCVCNVRYYLLIDIVVAEDDCIDTTVAHRIVCRNDEWWYVLGETCATLNHRGVAHTTARIGYHTRGEYDTVANDTVASYLCAIAEDIDAANVCVV